MKEYVMKISACDKEHPLAEEMILEFGCNVSNPKALVIAVAQFSELLKIFKTPEKVAEFMRKNSLANEKQMIVKGN